MNTITITFTDLVALQPQLKWLAQECTTATALNGYQRTRYWYFRAKPALVSLVGWRSRGGEILESTEAYDVAYSYLHSYCLNRVEQCKHAHATLTL